MNRIYSIVNPSAHDPSLPAGSDPDGLLPVKRGGWPHMGQRRLRMEELRIHMTKLIRHPSVNGKTEWTDDPGWMTAHPARWT